MLLKFDNEEDWLQARKQDVTSTEIAALFGLDEYKSRLRLWHEKCGTIAPEFVETDGTVWGRRLQTPVGMGICEDNFWHGEDLTGFYCRKPEIRLGSSFDIKAIDRQRGPGPLEVKVADSFSEDQGWTKTEAPTRYEFQLQTQMHTLKSEFPEISWGAIGALGRRQKVRLYLREYDAALGQMIDAEVSAFWKSIELDQPPKPDYLVDGEILERIRKPLRVGDIINLTGNNRAHELVESYRDKHAQRDAMLTAMKPINDELKAIKTELTAMIGRNEKAIVGDFQISAKEQVVEEFINHGSTFRRFDLSKRKGK